MFKDDNLQVLARLIAGSEDKTRVVGSFLATDLVAAMIVRAAV